MAAGRDARARRARARSRGLSGTSAGPGRWDRPPRRWHRPTPLGLLELLCRVVALLSLLAVLIGEWGRALVGLGAVLGGAVGSLYRAEDTDPPVTTRFGTPPDAPTQEVVHRAVAAGHLPEDPALVPMAVEYAAGWVRQTRRALAAITGAALAWCVVSAAVTVWFVHRWPHSAATRTGALVVTVAGAVAWAVVVVLPGRGRRRRLRALAGQR